MKRLFNFLWVISISAISFEMSASDQVNSPASASSSSSTVGYYRTTCSITVEGMSSSQFPTMDDFLVYMIGLNAAYCNGDSSLPDYSASPFPTEPSTTPDEG